MSSSPLDSSSDSSTLEMTSLMDVLPAPGAKPEPESPVKVQLKAVRQVQAEVARPIKFPVEEPAPVPVVGPGLAERAMELRREECRLLGARERALRGGQGSPGWRGRWRRPGRGSAGPETTGGASAVSGTAMCKCLGNS